MTSQELIITAAVAPGGITYDGYLYRSNLESTGEVPASPPFGLCPDIIRSSDQVSDPQSNFTTTVSLDTLYDCAPNVGQVNYYYLRALNCSSTSSDTTLGLYVVPAQLILCPSSWTVLTNGSGKPSISASAAPGHYAVGNEPFIWTAPALSTSGFYTFISQSTPSAPQVSSWHDLAALLARRLDYGVQSVASVNGNQDWEQSISLTIPKTFSGTTLALTITSNGFDGCRFGVIASQFTKDGKPVILNPVQLVNNQITGFEFQGEPGYDAMLYLQCWIGDTPVAAGSTISLELTCVVSDMMLEEAAERNLLDSRLSNRVARALSQSKPQPVMLVGAATLLVVDC